MNEIDAFMLMLNKTEEKLNEKVIEEQEQQLENELQYQYELDKLREENYDFEYGDYRY